MKSSKTASVPNLHPLTEVCYTFLTWNIWAAHPPFMRWIKRLPQVAAVLNQYHPDVFGLQEITRPRLHDLEKMLPQYAWVGVPRDEKPGAEYNPVIYRRDEFELLWHETLWLSPTPSAPSSGWDAAHPRIVTMARLRPTSGDNRDFMVMNSHLDHLGAQARTKSVELLTQLLHRVPEELPVILMGDFNFSPKHPLYQVLLRDNHLEDSAIAAQKSDDRQRKTWRGFLNSGLGKGRLDYLLTRNMTVQSYRVGGPSLTKSFPSDHFPVLGKFSFHQS